MISFLNYSKHCIFYLHIIILLIWFSSLQIRASSTTFISLPPAFSTKNIQFQLLYVCPPTAGCDPTDTIQFTIITTNSPSANTSDDNNDKNDAIQIQEESTPFLSFTLDWYDSTHIYDLTLTTLQAMEITNLVTETTEIGFSQIFPPNAPINLSITLNTIDLFHSVLDQLGEINITVTITPKNASPITLSTFLTPQQPAFASSLNDDIPPLRNDIPLLRFITFVDPVVTPIDSTTLRTPTYSKFSTHITAPSFSTKTLQIFPLYGMYSTDYTNIGNTNSIIGAGMCVVNNVYIPFNVHFTPTNIPFFELQFENYVTPMGTNSFNILNIDIYIECPFRLNTEQPRYLSTIDPSQKISMLFSFSETTLTGYQYHQIGIDSLYVQYFTSEIQPVSSDRVQLISFSDDFFLTIAPPIIPLRSFLDPQRELDSTQFNVFNQTKHVKSIQQNHSFQHQEQLHNQRRSHQHSHQLFSSSSRSQHVPISNFSTTNPTQYHNLEEEQHTTQFLSHYDFLYGFDIDNQYDLFTPSLLQNTTFELTFQQPSLQSQIFPLSLSISFLFYATVEYSAKINGTISSHTLDIPINTNTINITSTFITSPTIPNQNDQLSSIYVFKSSEDFNILPQTTWDSVMNTTAIDSTHLFLFPEKFLDTNLFSILSTQYYISIDILIFSDTQQDQAALVDTPTIILRQSTILPSVSISTTSSLLYPTNLLQWSTFCAISQPLGAQIADNEFNAEIILFRHKSLVINPASFHRLMASNDHIEHIDLLKMREHYHDADHQLPKYEINITTATPSFQITDEIHNDDVINDNTTSYLIEPDPELHQYTFHLFFSTSIPDFNEFYLSLYGFQYSFYGDFSQCTLNGIPIDVKDSQNNQLSFPNLYQVLHFIIPSTMNIYDEPDNDSSFAIGNSSNAHVVQLSTSALPRELTQQQRQQRRNKLVCLNGYGTIIQQSSIYRSNTQFQQQFRIKLPFLYNLSPPEPTHIPILLYLLSKTSQTNTIAIDANINNNISLNESPSPSPSPSSPLSTSDAFTKKNDQIHQSNDYRFPQHIINTSFTTTATSSANSQLTSWYQYGEHHTSSFTLYPPIPPPLSQEKDFTQTEWIIITVVCVSGMVISAVGISIYLYVR